MQARNKIGFFKTIGQRMNALTGNLIDWPRAFETVLPGSLMQSDQPISQQTLIRLGIATFTSVCGFLGYAMNNEERSGLSNTTVALSSATLGLIFVHIPVIYNLVSKRREMQAACEQFKSNIEQLLGSNDLNTQQKKAHEVMKEIFNIQLPKASETWGKRKRLLETFYTCLKDGNFEDNFSDKDVKSIVDCLDQGMEARENRLTR